MDNLQLDEKAIFNAALCLESAEDRQKYLLSVCGLRPEILERISHLLQIEAEPSSFLEMPAAGVVATLAMTPPAEEVGKTIGRYKLRELLGEGGMGSVYVAEQTEPVRRKVALKIIKPGMDSREVVARFEAERQALAMMDHANIARVLDGGTTESGQPYFVMELVRGVPITDYCDQHRLTTRARLEVFQQVCRAVQHAHQKGIIHRDLKPSNVLVAEIDGAAVPKVIDFGVAKAISQNLTDGTVYTQFSQMVGTPLYMSPEQAGLGVVDIDTRSDIYSLGVLLYELLTGETPFERERFKQVGLDEMRRIIREQEPLLPSARVSTLAAEPLSTIAEHHRIEPRRFIALLRGELDWIVMKSLEKDRARRYESAGALAAEVQRYLSGEPVLACPPNLRYRLGKFARRNKLVLISGALVCATLLIALVGTTWQAIVATRARDLADERYTLQIAAEERALEEARRANMEMRRANMEADLARKESEKARTEAAISKAVNDFINDDLLGKADLNRESDRELKVRDVLTRAAESIEGRFNGQPLIEAAIRNTIGDALFSLGLDSEAERQLKRVWELRRGLLGDDRPEIQEVLNNLAVLYLKQGRDKEAEPVLEKVLEFRRRGLGEEHPSTLMTACNLASAYSQQGRFSDAEPLMIRTLEAQRRVLGEDHADTLLCASQLALLFHKQSRFKEAEQLFGKVLDSRRKSQGGEDPDTLDTMSALAAVFVVQARYAEAKSLYTQVLDIRRRVLGEEHPLTLKSITDLGYVCSWLGFYEEAESLLTKALEAQCRVLGEEHPISMGSMQLLVQVQFHQTHYAEAEQAARKLLEIVRRVRGHENPETLSAMNTLANIDISLGRHAVAEKLLKEIVEAQLRLVGEDNIGTATYMGNLAKVYQYQGLFDKSESLYKKALAIKQRLIGEEHPMTLTAESDLTRLYLSQGRYAEAEPLLNKVLEIQKRVNGDEHRDTQSTLLNLAYLYRVQARFAESEKLYIKVLDDSRTSIGNEHRIGLPALTGLARLYLIMDHRPELENVTADILELWNSNRSQVSHQMLVSLTIVARSYCSMDKYANAEALLREYLKVSESNQLVGWERLCVLSLLGKSLVGQAAAIPQEDAEAKNKSLVEAEGLLLASFEGLEDQLASIPYSDREETITECLESLVKLYELRGDIEKSAEWKARLATIVQTPPPR